jgi:hypothetical protein
LVYAWLSLSVHYLKLEVLLGEIYQITVRLYTLLDRFQLALGTTEALQILSPPKNEYGMNLEGRAELEELGEMPGLKE